MLHLKTSLVVGSNRADLASLLKRYGNILVICNGRIRHQWERNLARFQISAEFINTADYLSSGISSETKFELVVIEDYPTSLHLPRADYEGMSLMNQLVEEGQNKNFDVLEIA